MTNMHVTHVTIHTLITTIMKELVLFRAAGFFALPFLHGWWQPVAPVGHGE